MRFPSRLEILLFFSIKIFLALNSVKRGMRKKYSVVNVVQALFIGFQTFIIYLAPTKQEKCGLVNVLRWGSNELWK